MSLIKIKPTPIEKLKAEKQSEIDALEASQYMTRGEREGWLAMIEAQATAQGVPLDLLYTANPFYKKLKDVDTAVSALRAELKAIV
jgi:1-aminocyclopropane-1-carboxylate deaminase/D-cysteine desulfhydrase-like pyridoxal-dependent ACC family enzyme